MREVREEVGICLDEQDLVFIEEIDGDLGPRDKAHLFEVELSRPFDVKIDEREILRAEFVLPEIALKRDLYQPVQAYLKAK